jgi:acetyl esterase/lipase
MSDVLERPPPSPDHDLAYSDDPAQHAALWLPRGDGGGPLVIALHRGYWRGENDLQHLHHLCRALRDEAGAAVVSLEYRRLGMGGIDAMLDDVTAGIAWARRLADTFPIAAGAPVVLGHSAGGQLALWAAAEGLARAVIALAPISDLRLGASLRLDRGIITELLTSGGSGDAHEVCTQASPIERLPLGVPTILIHGDADRGVPVAMSEGYARRARALGDDVTLQVLPGVSHLALIDPAHAAFTHVRDAVVRLTTAS